MGMLFRLPHGFLRRHLSWLERVIVAAALAFVLYQLMAALPVYPSPWPAVVTVAVFAVMLWSPPVGYFLAVIAALYPLYTISLYLAVLFLAIALLGQRVIIYNLGAALLVLSAPWLAQYHLEWLAILLGGLWWGKSGGAWMGGLAALWGQVLFGMTGTNPDWLSMMGTPPALSEIAVRYGEANSLETLQLLVGPIAPNPTLLLYHLLQIALWAMVGGLVGGLAESGWAQMRPPWRAIAVAMGGAALLLPGHLGLAAWLDQFRPDDYQWLLPGLFETALYAGLLSVFLVAGRDFFERPLPASRRSLPADQPQQGRLTSLIGRVRVMRVRHSASSTMAQMAQADTNGSANGSAEEPANDQEAYTPLPVPPNLPRRDAKKQRPDDIIKIELD